MHGISARIHAVQRSMASIWPLLRLVWRASPGFFLGAFALTLAMGFIPLVNIFVLSALIETIVDLVRSGSAPTRLPTNVVVLLLLLGVGNVLTQILSRVGGLVQQLHQTRVTNYVHLLIAEKAASIDLACFEDATFHNTMRTAANEASYKPMMFVNQLMIVASMLVTLVSLSVVIITWQVWIVPLIAVASLGLLWMSARFSVARVRLVTERAETERKQYYLNTLLTSDQTAKEIRLFGLQSFLLGSYRTLLQSIYEQDRQLAVRTIVYSSALGLLLAIVQPALFAFAAFQALQGLISIGQFSLYTQSMIQLEGRITDLMSMLGELHESHLFAANLLAFLATQPQVEAPRAQATPPTFVPTHTPRIEFRNVSFRYPQTQQFVLHNVSFTIQPGEAIALVGVNGAGKTTLVKLLAGLYEVSDGHILLDEVDIRTLDRATLRSYLSVIFQDYTIYHLTARENIGVGRVDWVADEARIAAAAHRSGLDHVVAQLPHGYDTVLGRFWEHGHELSGGQRQLVALTRALLRDAPILILDEPSAALDIYAEQHFFQRLLEDRNAGQLQTVIFISHRFTTVRSADRILVFADGNLVEQGTHDQLMAYKGQYADMYHMQAEHYLGGALDAAQSQIEHAAAQETHA